VFNLYDLTNGNYSVFRVVSYPDYPENLILFSVDIKPHDSEWATTIYLNGSYNGPTDFVANRDYEVRWIIDGGKLVESGGVELELPSGERLRQRWSSIISPAAEPQDIPSAFRRFPSEGEVVRVSISPFEVAGNKMRYEWDGTVGKVSKTS
jgi:hypothetical protein